MNCPLCESRDLVLFHDKVWSEAGSHVYHCKSCDIVFIWPMMSEARMKIFYKTYNDHVQSRGVTVSGTPLELHEKSKNEARARFKRISCFFKSTDMVLEIGSSTGAFLELLRSQRCFCVEAADDNRRFSERFVRKAYKDILEVPVRGKFDIICMFHVFEHILKPFEYLKVARKLLKRNGLMIVEVPCIRDPLIDLYDCRVFKDFYFQPMHPYIYSSGSLRYIFDKAGLVKEQEIYYQRYGLDNHLSWLAGKSDQARTDRLAKIFGGCREYKAVLEKEKITDTIFYITRNAYMSI